MDFSKLNRNELTAALASAVLIVAGLVAATTYTAYAITWLAILAAVGMLFVILQPQIAPSVKLPGSKGSFMVLFGGIAGVIMVIALLVTLGFIFVAFGFADVLFLTAIVAGITMAWTGWQSFQAEGGKFQLGTASATPAPQGAPATEPPVAAPAPSSPAATEYDADDHRPRDA